MNASGSYYVTIGEELDRSESDHRSQAICRFCKREERKTSMKVKLTITQSDCRCGHFQKGQEFLVGDLCPPLCHELWSVIYPYVFALQNGGILDHGAGKAAAFDAKCPDEARVWIHGEVVKE